MGKYASVLAGVGIEPNKAEAIERQAVNSQNLSTVSLALTASGTTIADALLLPSVENRVGTAALNTGVRLNDLTDIGGYQTVRNDGANTINIFPPTAAQTINAGAAGAASTLAAGAIVKFRRFSATAWYITA